MVGKRAGGVDVPRLGPSRLLPPCFFKRGKPKRHGLGKASGRRTHEALRLPNACLPCGLGRVVRSGLLTQLRNLTLGPSNAKKGEKCPRFHTRGTPCLVFVVEAQRFLKELGPLS